MPVKQGVKHGMNRVDGKPRGWGGSFIGRAYGDLMLVALIKSITYNNCN